MATKKKLTPRELEDLYDSGDARLSQERNDFLLPQILDFVQQKKWMNIRPEYQRRLVWDNRKKSKFIESLLMNIPVPPIFLYETDLSRYEVMDGQQRLNAILEFYGNNLKLKGLQTWGDLNGYTYDMCPPRIRRGLDRRRISATVLLAENVNTSIKVDSIRREVFERLNTGGQTLNPQELRNSLYSGRFNNRIIKLAGYRQFDEIWEIPPYDDHYRPKDGYISKTLASNAYFKRMLDCEIVLRFFALRRPTKIRGALSKILDECMQDYMTISDDELDKLEKIFKECLDISYRIFGELTFRVFISNDRWRLSVPLFDSVMVSVERLLGSKNNLIKNRGNIIKALEREFKKEKSYEVIVGQPNTAAAVKARIELVYKLMKRYA